MLLRPSGGFRGEWAFQIVTLVTVHLPDVHDHRSTSLIRLPGTSVTFTVILAISFPARAPLFTRPIRR